MPLLSMSAKLSAVILTQWLFYLNRESRFSAEHGESRRRGTGRPPVSPEVKELIRKMADQLPN